MKNRVFLIGVILSVPFFAEGNFCYAANLIIPEELVEIAQKRNCTQVSDFFHRPGMVQPPYIYGLIPGNKENSAAFWCEDINDNTRQFYLMFMY